MTTMMMMTMAMKMMVVIKIMIKTMTLSHCQDNTIIMFKDLEVLSSEEHKQTSAAF